MIKYFVNDIGYLEGQLIEPKHIDCLRVFQEKEEDEYGKLYEHTQTKSFLIFDVYIKKYFCRGAIKHTIEVLPQEEERYQKLKEVMIRRRISGDYSEDNEMPFAFSLQRLEKIET